MERTATGRYAASDLAERFWAKVEKTDACWLWRGQLMWQGYGMLWANGRKRRAHRVAWELANGRGVPDGFVVMHTCDVLACVRPDHLRVGTQAENIADRDAKGHAATGARNAARLYPEKWHRGEDHWGARLTAEKVREIRARRAAGERPVDLARVYGVQDVTITAIANRRIWRHVP